VIEMIRKPTKVKAISTKSPERKLKQYNPWKNMATNKPVALSIKVFFLILPIPIKNPIHTPNTMFASG
jgi:hypothetical protein